MKPTPIWDELGWSGISREGEQRASPIWVVRLPAAPLAHDDKLKRGNFAPRILGESPTGRVIAVIERANSQAYDLCSGLRKYGGDRDASLRKGLSGSGLQKLNSKTIAYTAYLFSSAQSRHRGSCAAALLPWCNWKRRRSGPHFLPA